ncbi:AraC family transcriptional regulator [Pedobacter cryoconitis]
MVFPEGKLNFDSSFYFSRIFREKTGLRPTEYRKWNHHVL